ncbi:MAG: universal stress protein [Hyphomonadaceae bacterium]|nr:universal stress protein [Hyphomonadaceae bacterium]
MMDYKTILAPVQFEETAKPILESAIMVADAFGAHIHAKHVRAPFVAYAPYAYHTISMSSAPVAVAEQFDAATAENAKKLKAIFEACCETAGLRIMPFSEASAKPKKTACWSDTTGLVIQAMAHFARVCDLSVVTLPDQTHEPRDTPLFEGLLMGSGRPILVVPKNGLIHLPKHILLAWDGSMPATRALQAALPMMKLAEKVHVATVGEVDFGMPSADSVAHYLTSHGIRSEARTVDWPKRPIAERLLNQAEATNSDLIVMGGYSHARLFETLLGGTTRHMLQHAERALFLAH